MQERRPRLEGKVAIVAGAGSSGPGIGNGKATSVLFAREGASVLLVDSKAERAEETLAMIVEEGGSASVFEADVTSADDCERMVEAAMERYGRLDVLVNVVGILALESVVDVSEETWDRMMEVNVKSIVLTSKFAIPRMIEGGGRLDSQRLLDSRAASLQRDALHHLEGRDQRAHHVDGRRPRARQRPGERHRSGGRLHTHGGRPPQRRAAEEAPGSLDAGHGGHRVGRRMGGSLSCQRRVPVGHRYDTDRRRRHNWDGA